MKHTRKKKINKPIADAGDNIMCYSKQDIYFDGSGSKGRKLTFHWDFGDGHSSTLPKPKHIYKSPGDYTVTLTVKDSSNLMMSSDRVHVNVIKNPYSRGEMGTKMDDLILSLIKR